MAEVTQGGITGTSWEFEKTIVLILTNDSYHFKKRLSYMFEKHQRKKNCNEMRYLKLL